MAKKLSKALRTDLNEVAALLRSKGRGRDTILAHIMPEEAALLKSMGGRGSTNPETGLPEFEFDWFSPSTWFGSGGETAAPEYEKFTPEPGFNYANFDEGPTSAEYASGTAQPGLTASEISAFTQPGETAFTYDDYPSQAMISQGIAYPTGTMAGLPAAEQAAIGSLPTAPTVPTAPGLTTPPPKDKGVMDTLEEYAKKYPKTTGALESLLGTGAKVGLGLLGARQVQGTQRRASQEAQQMADQYKALGQPIQAMGYQQLAQAEAGQLTPAQQRQIAATQAQQRQALARAGISSGTAQLQTQANLQRMANEFTQNNISTALNMIQFGDKYVANAIKAGYDANQFANQSANAFYQAMFGALGGTGNILRG